MQAQSTRTQLSRIHAFAVGVVLGAALAAILFGLVTAGYVDIPETGDRTQADPKPVAHTALPQGEGAVPAMHVREMPLGMIKIRSPNE